MVHLGLIPQAVWEGTIPPKASLERKGFQSDGRLFHVSGTYLFLTTWRSDTFPGIEPLTGTYHWTVQLFAILDAGPFLKQGSVADAMRSRRCCRHWTCRTTCRPVLHATSWNEAACIHRRLPLEKSTTWTYHALAVFMEECGHLFVFFCRDLSGWTLPFGMDVSSAVWNHFNQ